MEVRGKENLNSTDYGNFQLSTMADFNVINSVFNFYGTFINVCIKHSPANVDGY